MGILRILLALSVVAVHAGPILGTSLYSGGKAVEIFFVISGFYMAFMLSKKYAGPEKILLFYGNRWLRLYPTYFLTLVLTWLLCLVFLKKGIPNPFGSWGTEYHQMDLLKIPLIFANWTMIGLDIPNMFLFDPAISPPGVHLLNTVPSSGDAFWLADARTIPQAWSLGMEVWFYLLAPWIVKWSSGVMGVVIALSIGLRLWLNHVTPDLAQWVFLAQFFWFLIGVLLFRFYVSKHFRPLPKTVSLAPVIFLCLGFVVFPFIGWFYAGRAMEAFCCLLLPWVFYASRSNKLDRYIGNMSYPIYMLHLLVYYLLLHALPHSNGTVVAVATILLACVVDYSIETPLERLRARRVVAFESTRTANEPVAL